MVRLIAGCIAVGWVFAGWRNMPRLDHPSALAAGLAIGGTCFISYWCGRSLTRNAAYAAARANAEARALAASQSRAQAQAVVNVFQSAPAEERQALVPRTARGLEDAPWIAGPKSAVVEQDVLDSMLGDAGESVDQLAES